MLKGSWVSLYIIVCHLVHILRSSWFGTLCKRNHGWHDGNDDAMMISDMLAPLAVNGWQGWKGFIKEIRDILVRIIVRQFLYSFVFSLHTIFFLPLEGHETLSKLLVVSLIHYLSTSRMQEFIGSLSFTYTDLANSGTPCLNSSVPLRVQYILLIQMQCVFASRMKLDMTHSDCFPQVRTLSWLPTKHDVLENSSSKSRTMGRGKYSHESYALFVLIVA